MALPAMATAGTEVSRTVTVIFWQAVLLQVPSARTKYTDVAFGDTDTLAPVPIEVPPQLPLYHLHAAPLPRLPPLTDSVVL
jgi:hypothetical protein